MSDFKTLIAIAEVAADDILNLVIHATPAQRRKIAADLERKQPSSGAALALINFVEAFVGVAEQTIEREKREHA